MANTPISARMSSAKRTPSTGKDSSSIISIIENRAREVGVACINMKSFEISLTQFVDNTNYINTLSLIYSWNPIEIIMCKTADESPLQCQISSHLPGFDLTFVSRKLFDEVKGEEICINSLIKIHEQELDKKYVCLAALSALITQIELTQSISIYRDRLKICLFHLKNFLIIDYSTYKTLEIVVSASGSRKDSLAGLFDCKTQAGCRMLRATLLQPNKEAEFILHKLDAVQELMNNNVARIEIKSCLSAFFNTELVTSRLIQRPKTQNERYMKVQINNIINIFHNLLSAQSLLNILEKHNFECFLVKSLCELLDDRRIEGLYKEIKEVISEESIEVKSKKVSLFDCLFMIREGINPLLDISRQVYKNSLEEILKLETQYKYKLSEPGVCVISTSTRGYHLQIDPNILHKNYANSLGELLLQITHKGKKCFATTTSLLNLNEKLKSSQANIISLSFNILENLFTKAREKIICLYNISHAVASLDTLLAFSQFSIAHECSRPVFKPDKIALKQCRNPLMFSVKHFSPCEVKLVQAKRLQILTGENSAGKTTYLKTIALNCTLAHSGCFIPAKKAVVPYLDYILTRIGDKESIEQNCSSFLAEMRDCSYILNTATHKSLVIVDELGKSTSHIDGISLAWAICEKLLVIGSFVVLATHFYQLPSLEDAHEEVANIHIKDFVVSLGRGIKEYGYGIELAKKSALPSGVVKRAEQNLRDIVAMVSVSEKRIESIANELKLMDLSLCSKEEISEIILKLRVKGDKAQSLI